MKQPRIIILVAVICAAAAFYYFAQRQGAAKSTNTLTQQFSEFEAQLNSLGVEQIYSSRNHFIVFGRVNEKFATSYSGSVVIKTNPFKVEADSFEPMPWRDGYSR